MSSGKGEDSHPNARIMESRGGYGGVLADGRYYWVPRHPLMVGFTDFLVDDSELDKPESVLPEEPYDGPFAPDYGQKPRGGYRRISTIRSSGVKLRIQPMPSTVSTFIFVQGKESACLVSRGPFEDKETAHTLRMSFIGLADTRLMWCVGAAYEENVDIDSFAVVSVVLNPDNHKEEFKPDSSHKDPGSRFVNEEAAINLLKQKLENGTISETIQTAISALQCLYGENVKAHEIRVYGCQDKKADFLAGEEIERHLTVVNNV